MRSLFIGDTQAVEARAAAAYALARRDGEPAWSEAAAERQHVFRLWAGAQIRLDQARGEMRRAAAQDARQWRATRDLQPV